MLGYLPSVRWMSDALPWERCPRLQPWGPAVKRGDEGRLQTGDRVDPCDKFGPKLVGGGAPSDHRSLCDRLHRLRLPRMQRPWSEINQTGDVWWKVFVIRFYLLQSHFIFSLTYFCVFKFHDPPSTKWTMGACIMENHDSTWFINILFHPETLLSCCDVFLMIVGFCWRSNIQTIQNTTEFLINLNINHSQIYWMGNKKRFIVVFICPCTIR